MWKNGHVVLAMLVAPVLAILAWFAVDWFVAERPHTAQPGRDYPLVAKPNCRYASGRCDLVNEEFRLGLRPGDAQHDGFTLVIEASHPLSGATVGLAPRAGAASEPVAFTPAGDGASGWRGEVAAPAGEGATLQIVVDVAGSRYYAEVPAVFLRAE